MLLTRLKAMLRNFLQSCVVALGGIPQVPPQIGAAPATIEDGAQQIIDRARQGDQNALALICQIRDNARKKNPRAMQAFKALKTYIDKNPIRMSVSFGEEMLHEQECDILAIELLDACFGEEDYCSVVKELVPELAAKSMPKVITTLTNGPSLMIDSEGGNLFLEVRDSYPTEAEQNAFMVGMQYGIQELAQVPLNLQGAFLLGHVLGTARKFQAARLPDVPLKVLSPSLGAEFGEN